MLACDRVVHVGQHVARDVATVPQNLPEVAVVAGVQEGQVGLADGDVLRRGVGVQLLVPLLQEVALYALRPGTQLASG